jgi:hypothetical protein
MLLIAFAGFAYGMNSMISPEMYREIHPPNLSYVFVPDDDTFTDTKHRLEVQFLDFGPQSEVPVTVTAIISREMNGESQPLPLEPLLYAGNPTGTWFAVLPPLKDKGSRWFYNISIETSQGRTVEIWKHMNWFERWFSGFKKDRQQFWVTYEGNVVREATGGRILLVLHVVLTMGAILFLFHTLYYALRIIQKPTDFYMLKGYKSAMSAILSFLTGTIVIGIPITAYTFGVGFAPWPVRGLFDLGDVTDTKSTLLVIWWIVLLISYFRVFRAASRGKGDSRMETRFACWTVVAILVTVFVFLIPHSQFLQTSH